MKKSIMKEAVKEPVSEQTAYAEHAAAKIFAVGS